MWCRSTGWISGSKRERSLELGGALEFSKDGRGSQRKDLGVEELSVLKNLVDVHLI